MAEKVEILDIDTGNATRTLKDLKEEVKELRKELDNCELGSDEFADTLDRLTNAQTELKNATKTSTSAMVGSYDALVQKMAELKKQWRATADEIKRNELGKEIAEINQQLKDMDAELGNYQRNVGNYGSAFEGVSLKFEDGVGKFERLNTVSQDVIGSFDVLEGGLKAVGIESEVVAGLMDKLSGAMKMTQGFKSIKEGVGNFQQLKTVAGTAGTAVSGAGTAATTATTAISGLSVGLIAAVGAFAAVAAGAIYLAGNMSTLKQKLTDVSAEDKAKIAYAELGAEIAELYSQTAADKIVRIRELSSAYAQIGDDMDAKQQFVTDYKEELESMGIAMGSVNDADNIFINNTEAYVKAITARAKADALRDKAKADYAAFLEEEAKLEAELADQIAKRNAGTPDKTFWQNLGEAIIGASVFEGANVSDVQDFNDAWTDEIAERNVKAVQDKIDDARAKIDTKMEDMFAKAAELDKVADALLKPETKTTTGGSGSGGSGSSGGSKSTGKSPEEKAAEERAKRIQAINERLYKFNLNSREKELLHLKKTYEEELELVKDNAIAKQLLEEEYAKKQADINAKYDAAEAAEQAKKDAEAAVIAARRTEFENLQEAIIMSQLDSSEQQLRIIQNQYDEEKKLLDEFLAEKIISEEEYALAVEGIGQKRATAEKAVTEAVVEEETQYGMLGFKIRETGALTEENQKKIATGVNLVGQAFGQTSQLLSTLANNQNKETEKGFENYKKLSIAAAVMSMLQGIITSWTSAMSLPAPASFITGGIMSAFTATMGAIQIDQIKKQKFSSSGGGGSSTPNVPTVNTAALMSTPINYTTEVKGASAVEDAVDTRVYVVESDISDTIRKVEVAEEESTY